MNEIKDCWVSPDGKQIVLEPFDFMKGSNWREGNYEKENARSNKNLTPIIIDGRNIYEN